MADVGVRLGPLRLKNPVIAASSEFTMTEAGIMACLEAGAAAVVAKSVNESPDAARQLDIAEYVLVGPDRAVVPWAGAARGDSLFCRSGLAQCALPDWLAMLARCDEAAKDFDALVIGSVTVSEPGPAAEIAAAMSEVLRVVEVNLSAPHGREAARGAVRQLSEAASVRMYTEAVRAVVSCPLIIKLTGQSNDVTALAGAALKGGADIVALIGRYPGFLPDLATREAVIGSWAAIGGAWSLPLSLYWVSKCFVSLPGAPIIGTNGARDGGDVVRFVLSGASAVEMASAVLTHGPMVLGEAVEGVESYLRAQGVASLEELVGSAATGARTYAELAADSTRPEHRPWEDFLSSSGGTTMRREIT